MSAFRCALLLPVVAAGLLLGQARAGDWYVAPGASGDGTKASPIGGLHQAIDKAVAGDVIHVAQGTYHGKLSIGFIVIDKPGLTLCGGYKDATFAERNPFLYPTLIAEDPANKGSAFEGGYVRAEKAGAPTVHDSTTIDGFWFDRKGQNSYDVKGNLTVPTGSNTKPVIDFESPDCHVRNCVFLNTALYALRLNGDGSSVENCLFANVNYCGIELFGKGRKLEKGYPFHRFTVKNNTFFAIWNVSSLEAGAGAAITHSGNAHVEVTDNIFCLSMGQPTSMGWAVKDLKNMKADRWIRFQRNSCSQLRGGILLYYDPDTTASIAVWEKAEQLAETNLDEPEGNDLENPLFKLDPGWFERFVSVVPHEDVSNKKVDMDDYNKWARLLGRPLQDVPRAMGANFGTPYPIEHVQQGALWTTENAALKGRGVQAQGPFPVVKAALLAAAGGDEAAEEAPPAGDYEQIDWDGLMTRGEELVDKPVKLTCYYEKWDTGFTFGSGKDAKPYLTGTAATSHKILALRRVPEMVKGDPTIKGYVKLGSAAMSYVDKRAKRPGGRGACEFSFVVHAVVRKSEGKLMGKGPQVVLEVQAITAK